MQEREITYGRPVGSRIGSKRDTGAKKTNLNLYPEHREILQKYGEKYDLNNSGVVRMALLQLANNHPID